VVENTHTQILMLKFAGYFISFVIQR